MLEASHLHKRGCSYRTLWTASRPVLPSALALRPRCSADLSATPPKFPESRGAGSDVDPILKREPVMLPVQSLLTLQRLELTYKGPDSSCCPSSIPSTNHQPISHPYHTLLSTSARATFSRTFYQAFTQTTLSTITTTSSQWPLLPRSSKSTSPTTSPSPSPLNMSSLSTTT